MFPFFFQEDKTKKLCGIETFFNLGGFIKEATKERIINAWVDNLPYVAQSIGESGAMLNSSIKEKAGEMVSNKLEDYITNNSDHNLNDEISEMLTTYLSEISSQMNPEEEMSDDEFLDYFSEGDD